MAYIWNEHGKLPSEIYNLPPLEREFVYQATLTHMDAVGKRIKQLENGKKGGK